MRLVVACVVLVVGLFPVRARAYCLTTTRLEFVPTAEQPCDPQGQPLFWANRCVDVWVRDPASVQVDVTTARRLLSDALARWAAVRCPADTATCSGASGDAPSIFGREAGSTRCDTGYVRGGSNASVVAFRDSGWTHDPGTIALTTVSFRLDTGEILDGDIEVESDPHVLELSTDGPGQTRYDLASILTHESGHLFGLAHTQASHDEAVMRPKYVAGDTTMRTPAADDICGLCVSAPPSRTLACAPNTPPACDVTPPATSEHHGCGYARVASGSGLLALLLWITAARRGTASRRRSPGPTCSSCNR